MPEVGGAVDLNSTVLAFDFGEKRIGVAVGNRLIGIAHPLQTITTEANDRRFAQISDLIDEWQPEFLLVGLPFYIDGQAHEMTRLSCRFARRLQGRFGITVGMWDERLSSVAACQALDEIGVRGLRQKRVLDQVAAQHILQHYLDTEKPDTLLIQP